MTDSPQHAQHARLVFWGHACFGLHIGDTPWLLIDPFDPAGLGNTPGPPPIPIAYRYVTATHPHADHAAFHTQPDAIVHHAPFTLDDINLRVTGRWAAHDEFGGRLRGGLTQMLDVRIGGQRIVHAGDIGERPVGDTLDWLRTPKPSVLILPAGGYFTLGADGASGLAKQVAPHRVVFCHTADDGLPLPALQGRATVARRVATWPQITSDALACTPANADMPDTTPPTVVWMRRPSP